MMMNSDNMKMDLTTGLSSLSIGSNSESNNNEEKGTNVDNDIVTICANCGKEGGESMNSCNKCDLVVYCNASCKKKHRPKHKKKCEKRAAELYDATTSGGVSDMHATSAASCWSHRHKFLFMLWEAYLQWL